MGLARVRPAIAGSDAGGDAMAVAALQKLQFSEMAAVLPAEAVQTPVEVLAERWAAVAAAGQLWVAVERAPVDRIVGYGHAADGEIEGLLVHPSWRRRGHGGRLFAALATAQREQGHSTGSWWLPSPDPIGAGFARAMGWREVGRARVLDTGNGSLREVLWQGDLDHRLEDPVDAES